MLRSSNSSRSSLLLKAKAEAAEASVRAALGCKPDEARLLLEEQQMEQKMQQKLKAMQQEIYLEQLKREEGPLLGDY